jgi:SanA protein
MSRRTVLKIAFGVDAACLLALALMVANVQWAEADRIRANLDAVEPRPYAVVLGASVKKDGTPSDALRDRVMTGVELYKSGKARKILMTGDDGKFHVDEVSAMRKLAIDAGIPSEDILVDGHGYRTYESCKRASQIFDVKQAIVVTQRFHLGRALYLCSHFGMEVQGIAADKQKYEGAVSFFIRDMLASVKAWWDVNVWAPPPPVSY